MGYPSENMEATFRNPYKDVYKYYFLFYLFFVFALFLFYFIFYYFHHRYQLFINNRCIYTLLFSLFCIVYSSVLEHSCSGFLKHFIIIIIWYTISALKRTDIIHQKSSTIVSLISLLRITTRRLSRFWRSFVYIWYHFALTFTSTFFTTSFFFFFFFFFLPSFLSLFSFSPCFSFD